MNADPGLVIVTAGLCAGCSVHTTQVHHREFPEIWAEGGSSREGAEHLTHLFERALEAAKSPWHRDSMRNALVDVEAFLDALPASENEEGDRGFSAVEHGHR
jgi:hypothetical protein